MFRELLKAPVIDKAIMPREKQAISLITATFLCRNYIRWLAGNCRFQFPSERRGRCRSPIRGGSGLVGGWMASEKIGEDKIRFKPSWPNGGILDSVANTHLFLAWTACGDGRLAIHLQCLAQCTCRYAGSIWDHWRSSSFRFFRTNRQSTGVSNLLRTNEANYQNQCYNVELTEYIQ
jgi:hypothetical protein